MPDEAKKRGAGVPEIVKILVPAIASAIGAYYSATTESKQDAKASYETMAPTINELQRSVERLEQQNQFLWQTVALANSGKLAPLTGGSAGGEGIGLGSVGTIGHGAGRATGVSYGRGAGRRPASVAETPTVAPAAPAEKLTPPDELFKPKQGQFRSRPIPETLGEALKE